MQEEGAECKDAGALTLLAEGDESGIYKFF